VHEIVRTVTSYSRYTVFDDVRAHVSEAGVVTLSGKVTMPVKKEDIARRVASVQGVRAVHNAIEILPASPSDDELRQRVARAIYGNSAFWRYAAMPTPPIRIIVERGRVTLTGVVSSETDRLLARSLASGHGETVLACELRTER
jgi:osmotically-inducible protein OsmY